MNHPKCKTTGKRRYETAIQAGDAIFFANRGWHMDGRPQVNHTPKRMYLCADCGDWHLTSSVGRAA